jgi:cytochrome c oxidase subunit 2
MSAVFAVTEQAVTIERVWNLFLGLGVAVLGLVAGLMLWVIVRYRRRSGVLPPQKHYNLRMEITYIVVPLAIVLVLFGITVVSLDEIGGADADAEEGADLVVEVVAFQWQWQFHYPQHGVTVTGGPSENPELVLPASSAIRFDLTALDVIHSFWIPAFRFKRDMIPGSPGSFRVDVADVAGYYPNSGVCAEFCGLDHASMRFSVRILAREEFDAWITQQASIRPGEGGPGT